MPATIFYYLRGSISQARQKVKIALILFCTAQRMSRERGSSRIITVKLNATIELIGT